MKKIKIASTDITNIPFLEFILNLKKKTIISTGATQMTELEEIFDKIIKKKIKKILLYYNVHHFIHVKSLS